MNITFSEQGFTAEAIAAKQFNGTLVSDLSLQYKDIDMVVKRHNKTVSIKDQLWSSGKYKAIQIETQMVNTRTMECMDGCFYKNSSDYYLWRVETPEHGDTWLVIKTEALRAYVEAHKASLRRWGTTTATEAKNRSYGRTFDRAEGYVIPLKDVMALAKSIIPVRRADD